MTDRKPENVRALIARARELFPQSYDCHFVMTSLADACEQLLELVRKLQFGSCDNCGRREHCVICWHYDPRKHRPGCPVGALNLPYAEDVGSPYDDNPLAALGLPTDDA